MKATQQLLFSLSIRPNVSTAPIISRVINVLPMGRVSGSSMKPIVLDVEGNSSLTLTFIEIIQLT